LSLPGGLCFRPAGGLVHTFSLAQRTRGELLLFALEPQLLPLPFQLLMLEFREEPPPSPAHSSPPAVDSAY
jgi:hypothetical protein